MTLLMYEHTITPTQVTMLVVFGLMCIISYMLKDVPFFGKAWYVIKIFLFVVFGTLLGNYLKKEIKEWWNKD